MSFHCIQWGWWTRDEFEVFQLFSKLVFELESFYSSARVLGVLLHFVKRSLELQRLFSRNSFRSFYKHLFIFDQLIINIQTYKLEEPKNNYEHIPKKKEEEGEISTSIFVQGKESFQNKRIILFEVNGANSRWIEEAET